MDIKDIQELIKQVNKLNLAEVTIEKKDIKLTIRTHEPGIPSTYTMMPQQVMPAAASQPVTIPATSTPQQVADAADAKAAAIAEANLVTIKSPMIGTFYRSNGPDKEPFISVGQMVGNGDTICIIEAMKLFNEIESEISGKIVKILVDDMSPVEFDQPLFIVDPS